MNYNNWWPYWEIGYGNLKHLTYLPGPSYAAYNKIKWNDAIDSEETFKNCFPEEMKYLATKYYNNLKIMLRKFYCNVTNDYEKKEDGTYVNVASLVVQSNIWYFVNKLKPKWERLKDIQNFKTNDLFSNNINTTGKIIADNESTSDQDTYMYNQELMEDEDIKNYKYMDDGSKNSSKAINTNTSDITVKNVKYNIDDLENLVDITVDADAWVIDKIIDFIKSPIQPNDRRPDYYD